MQLTRPLVAFGLVGMLAAGCGGGSPTQAPAGATQNPAGTQGPAATQGPAGTQSGGGGGGGTGEFGSVTFTITGPFSKTATLDYTPVGSMFGGAAGTIMNFTSGGDGSGSSVLSIVADQSGKVIVSYVGDEGQVPAATCTTSEWNIQAQSGSGNFDCTATMSITSSGAMVEGGTIKGGFSAHT